MVYFIKVCFGYYFEFVCVIIGYVLGVDIDVFRYGSFFFILVVVCSIC